MKRILQFSVKALELAKLYPASFCGGWKNKKLFGGIQTYCMFIGYPRSGHSLVGSLVDAHPNIIVAHELDALQFIYARFSKRQIYYLLLENSCAFGKAGRKSRSYSYEVSNQWQGRFNKLQVIGDKHGEGTTLRLRACPWLLQRLRSVIDVEIKLIHTIRNPYDNISAISMKTKRHGRSLDLRESIEYYFSPCETVADVKKQIKSDDLFELRHESFIDSPKTYLKEICHFLGVNAPNDYLNSCASIVFKSSHKSRYDVQWSRELTDIVKNGIDRFPFLEGYSYED